MRLRGRLACLLLAIWLAGPASVAMAAADFDRLYGQGLAAKQAGDFELAAELLLQATLARPDSVDALRELGMVFAFTKRYEDARVILQRALELDPANDDVHLAQARVKSWQGDHRAAERDVDRVLARSPDNLEALELRGRLAYYQRRFGEAEAYLAKVLARAPNRIPALVALGDVLAAAEKPRRARDAYDRALALDPGLKEVTEKRRRLTRPERRWRLDNGFTHSRFSRQDRDPWSEGFYQLGYTIHRLTTLWGKIEGAHRFDQTDAFFEAGIAHRIQPWLTATIAAGATKDPDFLARWTVSAGATARLWRGEGPLGASLATIDYLRSDYADGAVDRLTAGLQQYLFAGRLALTVRRITAWDVDRVRSGGWFGRADFRPRDDLALYVTIAEVPETVQAETVDVRSYGVGIVVDVTPAVGFRLGYLYEDRENSYIRHATSAAFTLRF